MIVHRGGNVIDYEPFYVTIKEKGISTYQTYKHFRVSLKSTYRLKHNKPISTQTIDDLCKYLDCKVEDILQYKKDE